MGPFNKKNCTLTTNFLCYAMMIFLQRIDPAIASDMFQLEKINIRFGSFLGNEPTFYSNATPLIPSLFSTSKQFRIQNVLVEKNFCFKLQLPSCDCFGMEVFQILGTHFHFISLFFLLFYQEETICPSFYLPSSNRYGMRVLHYFRGRSSLI